MGNPKVSFELNTHVYDILFNALTNYEGDLQSDLLYDEDHDAPHLTEDRERVRLVGEMIAHLEVANSRVAT